MNEKQMIKHIRTLYELTERDLANVTIQHWIYKKEYENPIHISKDKAKESMDIYEKRIQFLKENLEIYKVYTQEVLNKKL